MIATLQDNREKERWANVPVWKRSVLEKREAQRYAYKQLT